MAYTVSRLARLGLAALVAATAATAAVADGASGPKVTVPKGEKCVEETEYMRRNHMDTILHQRDETMYKGIRTSKHSLKNCINCHADPKTNTVLGEDGFCSSCHTYASVSIDCFGCHSSKPEPGHRKASAAGGGMPHGHGSDRPAVMSLTRETQP